MMMTMMTMMMMMMIMMIMMMIMTILSDDDDDDDAGGGGGGGGHRLMMLNRIAFNRSPQIHRFSYKNVRWLCWVSWPDDSAMYFFFVSQSLPGLLSLMPWLQDFAPHAYTLDGLTFTCSGSMLAFLHRDV